MAARKHRKTHVVEQTEKVVPLIAGEIDFRQHVCELVFGVNICDLDLGVQVNSVEQPVKSNSVGSRHVSHCWTSSLNDHFDHNFVIFENVELRLASRRICVCDHVIHIEEFNIMSFEVFLRLGCWCGFSGFRLATGLPVL